MELLISKSISQLLLPPGGLILLALLGLLGWKRFWGRALVAVSMLLLWLISTEPIRDLLLGPLENRFSAIPAEQLGSQSYDQKKIVIVLLGGGIYEKAPEFGGQDMLSGHALMRTVYAAELARRSGLRIYSSGGRVLSESTEPEAQVMKTMLIRLGVSEAVIFAENEANNTWENAEYLSLLLADQGVNQVLLVTTAWHMPRSVEAFKAQGFVVIPAPCDFVVEREPYDLRSYLPRWNVMAGSADALHEYLGLIWYQIKYL